MARKKRQKRKADDDIILPSFEQDIEEFCNEGKKLLEQGDFYSGISLYIQALELIIESGDYLRIEEIFREIAEHVRTESDFTIMLELMRDIIDTIKYLDLKEEYAKITQIIADFYCMFENYPEAAVNYERTAKLYQKLDYEENFRVLAGSAYMKAAECYEKFGKYSRAEELVIKAISTFDISTFNYKQKFDELKEAIASKKYNRAIEIIDEIVQFFKRLRDLVDIHIDDELDENLQHLKISVKNRIRHMKSEFNLIKIACLKHLNEWEEIERQTKETIQTLIETIEETKEQLNRQFTTVDLHRYTFSLFLLAFIQEFTKIYEDDPIFIVTSGLNKDIEKILVKTKFYKYTLEILENNLDVIEDFIEELPLSPILTPFKKFIYKTIEKG